MAKKVLVIEDDLSVGQTLKILLELAGYKVTVASSGGEGLEKARESRPDLILLDIMMPGMNGWQTCRQLRAVTDVSIVLLTVLGGQENVIKGLEMGADDFITKPWSNQELLARIHAALRRAHTSPPVDGQSTYSYGNLVIDLIHREVSVGRQTVHLTPIEFRLLAYLARRPGRVVTYSELIAQIWGIECEQDIDSLRWHVHNLRRKIERDPRRPRYLHVRHGVGYCLIDQGHRQESSTRSGENQSF